eukprot:g4327.t1
MSNNNIEKAEELKRKGNEAYKSGNYEKAISFYAGALELDPKNVVYYSNRSAAYLAAGMNDKALKDAKKCSSLDVNYAKGFLRKGNALFAQRKFSLAMKAYARACELAPENNEYKNKLKLAQNLEGAGPSAAQQAAPGSNGASSAGGSADARFNASLGAFLAANRKDSLRFAFDTILVCNLFIYLLPFFGGVSKLCYRIMMFMVSAKFLYTLVERNGMPRMNSEYFIRCLQSSVLHKAILAFMFASSRPYLPAAFTMVSWELVLFGFFLARLLQNGRGNVGLSPSVGNMLTKFIADPVASSLFQSPQWKTMTLVQRWQLCTKHVPELNALFDVGLGIFLLIEIVTPMRNLMLAMMYWQILRMRYMVAFAPNPNSGKYPGDDEPRHLVQAFSTMNGIIEPQARKIGIVHKGYTMICKFLKSMVKLPQQGGQQQGSAGGGLSGMIGRAAQGCSIQ